MKPLKMVSPFSVSSPVAVQADYVRTAAGIPIEGVRGSDTSVYAGILFRDYHDTLCRDPEETPRHFIANNAATMYSNRVSHFFDLRGASLTVDTACSTTLTAIHLACQNLRAGESRMSIVTGANLMINPDIFITMSNLGLVYCISILIQG